MARGPKNAQIRKDSDQRQSRETIAAEADRLLNDPAFQRGYKAVREGIIGQLEAIQHDGSESMEDYERELCRSLRTLHRVRRAIAIGVQGQQLREADFRPRSVNED